MPAPETRPGNTGWPDKNSPAELAEVVESLKAAQKALSEAATQGGPLMRHRHNPTVKQLGDEIMQAAFYLQRKLQGE